MLSRNDLEKKMMEKHASFEQGGVIDAIMGTQETPLQSVGGTTFSNVDLTAQMDITNPTY
jgi:hypothetical protein